MWQEVRTQKDADALMLETCDFHDGCIKELQYTSGAYFDEALSPHPANDRRVLRMILQMQDHNCPVVELEFSGLSALHLVPPDADHSAEISGATLTCKNGLFCFADTERLPSSPSEPDGLFLTASALRWRKIEGHLGDAPCYPFAE